MDNPVRSGARTPRQTPLDMFIISGFFAEMSRILCLPRARAAEKFKLPGSADYKVQDFLGKCAISRQYDRHFYFAKPHVSH